MVKLKILFFLLFSYFIASNIAVQAQDTTITNHKHILIAIEDSLRNMLISENDSSWLNNQLTFQSEVNHIENIKYKLVGIGKKDFYEGPFHELDFNLDSLSIQSSTFGQDSFSILGYKFYTYIGNSSWGFYYQYHFERVYPIQKIDIQDVKRFKTHPTCKHGWNQLRGQVCYQCLEEYRQQDKK